MRVCFLLIKCSFLKQRGGKINAYTEMQGSYIYSQHYEYRARLVASVEELTSIKI